MNAVQEAYSLVSFAFPMIPVAIVALVLTIVARHNPAVAVVPRRRALVTWAGVLIALSLVGGLFVDVPVPVFPIMDAFCAAVALTLVAVELICTALTRPDGAEAPPPW